MRMILVKEFDQTIIYEPLRSFKACNDFIKRLVAEAKKYGSATMDDTDGCPVTATVWDEKDPR